MAFTGPPTLQLRIMRNSVAVSRSGQVRSARGDPALNQSLGCGCTGHTEKPRAGTTLVRWVEWQAVWRLRATSSVAQFMVTQLCSPRLTLTPPTTKKHLGHHHYSTALHSPQQAFLAVLGTPPPAAPQGGTPPLTAGVWLLLVATAPLVPPTSRHIRAALAVVRGLAGWLTAMLVPQWRLVVLMRLRWRLLLLMLRWLMVVVAVVVVLFKVNMAVLVVVVFTMTWTLERRTGWTQGTSLTHLRKWTWTRRHTQAQPCSVLVVAKLRALRGHPLLHHPPLPQHRRKQPPTCLVWSCQACLPLTLLTPLPHLAPHRTFLLFLVALAKSCSETAPTLPAPLLQPPALTTQTAAPTPRYRAPQPHQPTPVCLPTLTVLANR